MKFISRDVLKKLSINYLELMPNGISYNYCIENNYTNIEQVLKLPREVLVIEHLFELFESIHELNLNFDYEEQYACELNRKFKNSGIIKSKDLSYLFDVFHSNYPIFFNIPNSLELIKRLELLVNLNKISNHDKILFNKVFNININKIEEDLKNARIIDPNLNLPILETNLPSRAKRAFCRFGFIKDLGDLILLSSNDLKWFRNIGELTREQIISEINSLGYTFSDDVNAKKIKRDKLLKDYQILLQEKENILNYENILDERIQKSLDELNNLDNNSYLKVRK